jgi:hypothetical protein
METTVTKSGNWKVEITNTIHGVLEQGGVCGRVELWTETARRDIGLDPQQTPESLIKLTCGDTITGADYLMMRRKDYLSSAPRPGVKVMRKGNINF